MAPAMRCHEATVKLRLMGCKGYFRPAPEWLFCNTKLKATDLSKNTETPLAGLQNMTAWWFQTFFTFHNIWDVILPIDELIFFKMVIAPPTRFLQ